MHIKLKCLIKLFLLLNIHILFFSLRLNLYCDGATVDNDLNLSYEQKLNLDKLKKAVVDKLPKEYMKTDVYLIRWLRAQDFNPAKAEEMLMKNIQWREQTKMDSILAEDWSDMEDEYPYNMEGRDKEGKPVFIGSFGMWDLRRADVTGRFDRLIRYGERIMEEEEALIRKLQSEGKLVTRTVLILDMDGFNLAQHMCSRCFSYILGFYQSFEEHHPGLVDKLFIINNHPIVNTVLQAMLNNFSPQTRKIVSLYNRNKNEYSTALLNIIAPDQLPDKYGGTKKES